MKRTVYALLCMLFCGSLIPAAAGTEMRAGTEYLPVNIGELFLAMRGAGSRVPLERPVVYRGRILRDAHFTAMGSFAVIRTAIVCCVLDANVLGVQVRKTAQTRVLGSGVWVKVYGRFEKSSGAPLHTLDPALFNIEGNRPKYAGVRTDYLFKVDHIVRIPVPQDKYVMKWQTQPPYQY